MEPYKRIKKFAKEGKINITPHAVDRAIKWGIKASEITKHVTRGLILNTEEVEGLPDPKKPNKYYCICKSFLTWITLILLIDPDVVWVITVYPSKPYEKRLYQRRKRFLHDKLL